MSNINTYIWKDGTDEPVCRAAGDADTEHTCGHSEGWRRWGKLSGIEMYTSPYVKSDGQWKFTV